MSLPAEQKVLRVVKELGVRPMNIPKDVPRKSQIKLWAYKNAFMLIFLALLFFITWILLVCYGQGWLG